MAEQLTVQVCYATPAREILLEVQVAPGCTIEQAIAQSALAVLVPGIDLASLPVGIFAKKKPLDTPLRDGDRIEVYRALVADPKESRRRRVEKKTAGR